jgi:hypothetical protein
MRQTSAKGQSRAVAAADDHRHLLFGVVHSGIRHVDRPHLPVLRRSAQNFQTSYPAATTYILL